MGATPNDTRAAMESLLPMRTHAVDNKGYSRFSTTPGPTDKSPKLREKYLKQLGYTPLVFRNVKRFGSIIASLSPIDRRKRPAKTSSDEHDSDAIEADAFPYHQSIIPSTRSIRGSVFNLALGTVLHEL